MRIFPLWSCRPIGPFSLLDLPDGADRINVDPHRYCITPSTSISISGKRAALESVLGHGNLADLESGLRICLRKGWTDSLAEASKRSTQARTLVISILTKENTTRRQTLSALEALAAACCSP